MRLRMDDRAAEQVWAGRSSGALFVLGGLINLVGLVLPTEEAPNRIGNLAVSLLAVVCGAVIWSLPWQRWSMRATLWLCPSAFLVIMLKNVAGSSPHVYANYFVLVFVWIGLWHAQGMSLKWAPAAVFAYAGPLWWQHAPTVILASTAYVVPTWVLVGEILAWVSTRFRDSEGRYRVGESRQQILFDQLPALVWSTDADFRVTSGHGSVYGHGIPRGEDALGADVFSYLAITDPEAPVVRAILDAMMGRSATCECERADRVYEVRVEPLRSPVGAVVGTIGLCIDITDRRLAERRAETVHSVLEAALDSTADGILVVDTGGRIVNANKRFVELWGIPAEILESGDDERAMSFVLDQLREPVVFLEKVRQLYADPVAESFDVLQFKDGRVFERLSMPQRIHGRTVGRVWSFRDVSGRQRTEEALRRQAGELEALHQTTLGLLDEVDPNALLEQIVARAGALVSSDDAYVYVLDAVTDELVVRVGTGVFASHVGYRLKRGEGLAGRVLEAGESMAVADYGHWSGGTDDFEWLHAVMATPLRIGSRIVGVIGVAIPGDARQFADDELELLGRFGQMASLALQHARLLDAVQEELGERVKAEGAIRESELRYRLLFESNPHPMWVFDQETLRFLAVNDAAIHHYGYSRAEFMSMGLADIRPPEDVPRLMDAAPRFQGQDDVADQWRHRRKDGSVMDVEVLAHAIEFGNRPARLVLATDITERKASERALIAGYERERQAADELRRLNEMKNAFLTAVSHELRTPLTSVVGYSDTLERWNATLTEDERGQMLVRLSRNARKLDRLLTDLLDVDRLTRGILKPNLKNTEIGALVRGVVENAEYLEGRRVHVETHPMVIKVDAPKVERIIENLMANAVRHTPEGTEIWVKAQRDPRGVLISVEDAGTGIPRHIRESIFEPFQQGPDRLEHSPGVGIGLSLVARFADLHHGRAWVEERAGGGSSFKVLLPEPTAGSLTTADPAPVIVPHTPVGV